MAAADHVGMHTKPLPSSGLAFDVPADREAGEPPEARGLQRDEVRLLVSYLSDDRIVHARFRDLTRYLQAGDVLAINTSATRPAALPATDAEGRERVLHLSTELPAGLWLVELRRPQGPSTAPFFEAARGETYRLPQGASVTLYAPFGQKNRLWVAGLDLPRPLDAYLALHGSPIRYGYVHEEWPIDAYQTVYATEAGSAEMPSAGRPFTPELLTRLMAGGVQVMPLLLHAGVASLEAGEPLYEEYYRVPAATARAVNAARAAGGRVIAVGTTVVRALETVADQQGNVHPGQGWTDVVITPRRGLRAVDGMLTGFHEPQASHLALLETLAGAQHLRLAYGEALEEGYLWHEFGDLHLLLP